MGRRGDGRPTATQVVITDALPISTTYQACLPGACGSATGVVSWPVGTLLPNSSVVVTLVVLANSDVPSDTFIFNDHYGVICAEIPSIVGNPVPLPTVIRIDSFRAQSTPGDVPWWYIAPWLLIALAGTIAWRKSLWLHRKTIVINKEPKHRL